MSDARRDESRGHDNCRDGSGWTDWQDLGGNYAYEPALYEYDGGYYLTYTGEDGYAYTKEYKAGEPEE